MELASIVETLIPRAETSLPRSPGKAGFAAVLDQELVLDRIVAIEPRHPSQGARERKTQDNAAREPLALERPKTLPSRKQDNAAALSYRSDRRCGDQEIAAERPLDSDEKASEAVTAPAVEDARPQDFEDSEEKSGDGEEVRTAIPQAEEAEQQSPATTVQADRQSAPVANAIEGHVVADPATSGDIGEEEPAPAGPISLLGQLADAGTGQGEPKEAIPPTAANQNQAGAIDPLAQASQFTLAVASALAANESKLAGESKEVTNAPMPSPIAAAPANSAASLPQVLDENPQALALDGVEMEAAPKTVAPASDLSPASSAKSSPRAQTESAKRDTATISPGATVSPPANRPAPNPTTASLGSAETTDGIRAAGGALGFDHLDSQPLPGWSLHLMQGSPAKRQEFLAAIRQQLRSLPAHEQISIQMQRAARDGMSRLTIQLSPAELGRIHVRMEIDDEKRVTAAIVVERPATLDLLQRDARMLERALHEAGLKLDANGMSFNLAREEERAAQGGGQSTKGGSASQSDQADGEEEPAPETNTIDVASGLLNMRV